MPRQPRDRDYTEEEVLQLIPLLLLQRQIARLLNRKVTSINWKLMELEEGTRPNAISDGVRVGQLASITEILS